MEIFFIGLVLWIGAGYLIAYILPFVVLAIGYSVTFVFLCLIEGAKLLVKLAVPLMLHGLRQALPLIGQGWCFLRILFDEWRTGPNDEWFAGDEQDDEDADAHTYDSDYDDALALFGLTEPFTQAELKQVYRAAMKRAHTDVGGRLEAAQAFNAARDLILQMKGWA